MFAANEFAVADKENLNQRAVFLFGYGNDVAVFFGAGMLQLLLLRQKMDAVNLIAILGGFFKIQCI